jgi:hypothetical protein
MPIESQQIQTNSSQQYINISDEFSPARLTYHPSTSAAGDTSTVNAKGSYSVINGSAPPINATTLHSELFYHRNMTVNQNSIALSSDRGSLEIAGISLLYEGTRVKSYLLGRDLNPMGRGDGMYYCQGGFGAGSTRPSPTLTAIGGWGNSVNNSPVNNSPYDDYLWYVWWTWGRFKIGGDPPYSATYDVPPGPSLNISGGVTSPIPPIVIYPPFLYDFSYCGNRFYDAWEETDGDSYWGYCAGSSILRNLSKHDICEIDGKKYSLKCNLLFSRNQGGVEFGSACENLSEDKKTEITTAFFALTGLVSNLSHLSSRYFSRFGVHPPDNHIIAALSRLSLNQGKLIVDCQCDIDDDKNCGLTPQTINRTAPSDLYHIQLCSFVHTSTCAFARWGVIAHEFAHAVQQHRSDYDSLDIKYKEFQSEGFRRFFDTGGSGSGWNKNRTLSTGGLSTAIYDHGKLPTPSQCPVSHTNPWEFRKSGTWTQDSNVLCSYWALDPNVAGNCPYSVLTKEWW